MKSVQIKVHVAPTRMRSFEREFCIDMQYPSNKKRFNAKNKKKNQLSIDRKKITAKELSIQRKLVLKKAIKRNEILASAIKK